MCVGAINLRHHGCWSMSRWLYRSAQHVVRHIVHAVSRSCRQKTHRHTLPSWCAAAVGASVSSARCSSPATIHATTSQRDTACVNCGRFSSAARWRSLAARRKPIWLSWQWRRATHRTGGTLTIQNMPVMLPVWRWEQSVNWSISKFFKVACVVQPLQGPHSDLSYTTKALWNLSPVSTACLLTVSSESISCLYCLILFLKNLVDL